MCTEYSFWNWSLNGDVGQVVNLFAHLPKAKKTKVILCQSVLKLPHWTHGRRMTHGTRKVYSFRRCLLRKAQKATKD